jgi:hypothetical protein
MVRSGGITTSSPFIFRYYIVSQLKPLIITSTDKIMGLLHKCADLARQRHQQSNAGAAADDAVVDMADLVPLPLGRTIEIHAGRLPDEDDGHSSAYGSGSYGRHDNDADTSISVFDFARQQPPLAAAAASRAAAQDSMKRADEQMLANKGLRPAELWPAVVQSAAMPGAHKWLVPGSSSVGKLRMPVGPGRLF